MSDLIQTTAEAEGGHCVTGGWGDLLICLVLESHSAKIGGGKSKSLREK